MDTVAWTDVAQVGLVATQLLVLIVAAAVAWKQVKEARTLREEQNRPFVVVDFEVDGGYLIYLEVKNLGTSLARDVVIDIEPALESALDIDVGNLKMLTEGMATVAPGKELRTFFDMGFRRSEREDLPMNYLAKVSYTDEKGKRKFEEVLNLDLDQYTHIRTITRHGLHDIHKQLDSIRKTLDKWSSGIGRGLLTLDLEDSRLENERRLAEFEKRKSES